MTRQLTRATPDFHRALPALVALGLALGAPAHARSSAANLSSDPGGEHHHYSISARVRPLLVFWISRSGVGDAVFTKRKGPGEAGYSLLIGSDPDRAPRRINRWGYLDEEIRGGEATLIGLMTESAEDSVKQVEANIGRPVAGDRAFKIIRATIDGDLARVQVGGVAYAHVIRSDFEARSTYDGEVDPFSITYGTEGPLAEIPLAASYQPRWWLQVELTLDDTTSGPALGPNP